MRHFWHSLQFRIPTVFLAFFLLILIAVVAVFSTLGRSLLEEQAYTQVLLTGENIVAELGKRTTLAESLAISLANLGEQLPQDDTLTNQVVMHVLDHEGSEHFIAGGGIWPAPYRYHPDIERRSFFWGRDSDGLLQYFDDYNNPDGPGYHHEEWYVPATHLEEGEVFWSRSYMDPYSYQPMVTVTVPMYREGRFYGVSTVDLKLEGLQAFLAATTESFGGYAFAVDRNGKFLSFPNEHLTRIIAFDPNGGITQEFITISKLAEQMPAFAPLANAVTAHIETAISTARGLGRFDDTLAASIASDSYQIESNEAQLIAALLGMRNAEAMGTRPPEQLFIEHDPLLAEPAFAAVFDMPQTAWKVVTIMPYSTATASSGVVYSNLISAILIVMFISLLIVMLFVRRILVQPITGLAGQLKLIAEDGYADNKQLVTDDRGELGMLVRGFNQRTQRLLEAQRALKNTQIELEERVDQRTAELVTEIESRERESKEKDLRRAREAAQHAAIVDLSLDDQLTELDLQDAGKIITRTACETIDASRASIWLLNEQAGTLDCIDLYDGATRGHTSDAKLVIAQHPEYLRALEEERSLAVENLREDRRVTDLRAYSLQTGVLSLLDAPLRDSGRLIGVLCIEQTGITRSWHDDEIRFCGELGDQFQQLLAHAARRESEEQVRRLAFYDPLTGLANRRLLFETLRHELEASKRRELFGSLIYLDLDNFKTLNDSLGHSVGDELLEQVGERLKVTLRAEDLAARLGGDEFVILLSADCHTQDEAVEQAANVAEKVRAAISEPYRLGKYDHVITTSIGIALYPEGQHDANDVLKHADAAMYRAKQDGRNRIAFYDPQMQEAAENRLLLERELRKAIANRNFELYYQLQVNREGQAVGAEALIRWIHPRRGVISPLEFIGIAEETGLILEIGDWVLEEACRFIGASGLDHIAVNISPLQFRHPDFVERIKAILDDACTDPRRLMLEVTETVVIDDIDDTVAKMHALKALGVRFAIDDFGTGHSSLAYLKRLPLDQLKIANEFVRDVRNDPNDAIIVETIISMARHLRFDLVAEGVESEAQLSFLLEKGCHLFQGYFFSKPVPRHELEDRILQFSEV